MMAMVERNFKKTKKDFVQKKFPGVASYQTAIDTQYTPKNLSTEATDILSQKFVELDRHLKDGFTVDRIA